MLIFYAYNFVAKFEPTIPIQYNIILPIPISFMNSYSNIATVAEDYAFLFWS